MIKVRVVRIEVGKHIRYQPSAAMHSSELYTVHRYFKPFEFAFMFSCQHHQILPDTFTVTRLRRRRLSSEVSLLDLIIRPVICRGYIDIGHPSAKQCIDILERNYHSRKHWVGSRILRYYANESIKQGRRGKGKKLTLATAKRRRRMYIVLSLHKSRKAFQGRTFHLWAYPTA